MIIQPVESSLESINPLINLTRSFRQNEVKKTCFLFDQALVTYNEQKKLAQDICQSTLVQIDRKKDAYQSSLIVDQISSTYGITYGSPEEPMLMITSGLKQSLEAKDIIEIFHMSYKKFMIACEEFDDDIIEKTDAINRMFRVYKGCFQDIQVIWEKMFCPDITRPIFRFLTNRSEDFSVGENVKCIAGPIDRIFQETTITLDQWLKDILIQLTTIQKEHQSYAKIVWDAMSTKMQQVKSERSVYTSTLKVYDKIIFVSREMRLSGFAKLLASVQMLCSDFLNAHVKLTEEAAKMNMQFFAIELEANIRLLPQQKEEWHKKMISIIRSSLFVYDCSLQWMKYTERKWKYWDNFSKNLENTFVKRMDSIQNPTERKLWKKLIHELLENRSLLFFGTMQDIQILAICQYSKIQLDIKSYVEDIFIHQRLGERREIDTKHIFAKLEKQSLGYFQHLEEVDRDVCTQVKNADFNQLENVVQSISIGWFNGTTCFPKPV